MPSFILIRPTVWPQYTNVTDGQGRRTADSIGRTVFGRPFVKRFALCYRSVVLSVCLSVCNVRALWPNGWTDQHEKLGIQVGLGPGHIVLGGDPAPPSPNGHSPLPPIFDPYLLRPNGCMDQDVTWCGARPRPKRLCVRWGTTSPSSKGAEPPTFGPYNMLRPNACMPLGMEVSLGVK